MNGSRYAISLSLLVAASCTTDPSDSQSDVTNLVDGSSNVFFNYQNFPNDEGIAQIIFLRNDAVCKTSYADKKGKYQDQKGLTLPFVTGSHPR